MYVMYVGLDRWVRLILKIVMVFLPYIHYIHTYILFVIKLKLQL